MVIWTFVHSLTDEWSRWNGHRTFQVVEYKKIKKMHSKDHAIEVRIGLNLHSNWSCFRHIWLEIVLQIHKIHFILFIQKLRFFTWMRRHFNNSEVLISQIWTFEFRKFRCPSYIKIFDCFQTPEVISAPWRTRYSSISLWSVKICIQICVRIKILFKR